MGGTTHVYGAIQKAKELRAKQLREQKENILKQIHTHSTKGGVVAKLLLETKKARGLFSVFQSDVLLLSAVILDSKENIIAIEKWDVDEISDDVKELFKKNAKIKL
jgi:hypothetical protein